MISFRWSQVGIKTLRVKLPLDPGALAAGKELLARLIESVWMSAKLSLKIEWTEVDAKIPDLFRFILEKGTSGRSWVTWAKKQIHLFTEIKASVVAHEIGHVLGFRDNFYTVWHPERYEYVDQYNEEDLMSDHFAGSVTAEEWKTLAERYPVK